MTSFTSPVTPDPPIPRAPSFAHRPFRRAVLRGLGIVLPPLLTIAILAWIVNSIGNYVLEPVETCLRYGIIWVIDQSLDKQPAGAEPIDASSFRYNGRDYFSIGSDQWIPTEVHTTVRGNPGTLPLYSSKDYYHRYVQIKYLKRWIVLPIFLIVFVLFLYLVGRFLAAGVGHIVYNSAERIIAQLPFIRTVYSSVKQVTDFVFSDTEMEFSRVVAVEYPRRGIWSLGFVTGESMPAVRAVAGEPVLTVLIPTSPMPATGFTVTVRKSEAVDVNMTVDQAFQFIVSCGVVVPPPQCGASDQIETPDKLEPAESGAQSSHHHSV